MVTLPKQEVASVEDVDTWVVRIHHVRWYLAAAMGALVLLMTWRWFDREEVASAIGCLFYFATLTKACSKEIRGRPESVGNAVRLLSHGFRTTTDWKST